jgi:hypothetical protein
MCSIVEKEVLVGGVTCASHVFVTEESGTDRALTKRLFISLGDDRGFITVRSFGRKPHGSLCE